MKNLFMESGFASMNKQGETLCGDYYTAARTRESTTLVLSDGLGSGVKANILSTLSSTILTTLMASRRLSMAECVQTVAETLPMCSERHLAYSTFTIFQFDHLRGGAYLAQFDNPLAILLRDGRSLPYEITRKIIGGKEIDESAFTLQVGDMLVFFTDGVTSSGLGKTMPDGWLREDVIRYLEQNYTPGLSPQRLADTVLSACRDLALGSPDDDVTVVAVKMRERSVVNLLIGPPERPEDDRKVLRLFFSKEGKHVVCGGSTAQMVSRYLGRPLTTQESGDPDVPAASLIDGVDLVTEGAVTLGKVRLLSDRYVEGNGVSLDLKDRRDGASNIARLLFEEATDVNLFVGRAANAANAADGLDVGLAAKLDMISRIEKNLNRLGRHVKVNYC